MSILKYKYKAHKFVNYAFYLVVFIVGFLLGFTTNKIDFNKLINQVLMIDSVQAYSYGTFNDNELNEDFIYNTALENFDTNFSFEKYPYVACTAHIYTNSPSHLNCYFLPINTFEQLAFNSAGSDENVVMIKDSPNYDSNNFNYYYFEYFVDGSLHIDNFETWTPLYNFIGLYLKNPDDTIWFSATNFNISEFPGAPTTYDTKLNLLDFNKYKDINYWLNDGSIFKDENHQDFKEICWENFDELMFSVTIDSNYDGSSNIYQEGQQDGETYVKNGFYVFDDVRKLKRGTRIHSLINDDYKYDASTWLGGATFNHLHNITSDFYLMDTEEKIGIRYSDPTMALGNYDIYRGDSYYYDNLNKLLNATYVDFTYYYNVLNDFRYDIFYLEDKKEKFCIYIPNQFVVTTLSINELGGFIGDIPTHNGKNDSFIDVTVTTGQLHFNQLFTIINNFISSIRNTVIFINNFIYSFFVSLHPLIQMFIFTIISLLVVKLIIGMVVK